MKQNNKDFIDFRLYELLTNPMCIFCDITKKNQSADIVFENDAVLVFKDMNPSAPIHLLIVPKKHIVSIDDILELDRDLISEMIFVAKKIAKQINVQGKYRLSFNVGRGGGQLVDHIHLHFLAWPDGNYKDDHVQKREERKEVLLT